MTDRVGNVSATCLAPCRHRGGTMPGTAATWLDQEEIMMASPALSDAASPRPPSGSAAIAWQ